MALEKDIAKLSYACMSDAKWRKLFSVVNDSNLEISNCLWKLVGEPEARNGFVPDYDQLGEEYVGDCGALNGPFEFKRIEWLKLLFRFGYRPYENAPLQYKTQNLAHIVDRLKALGAYEMEEDSEGVTIYGYKP